MHNKLMWIENVTELLHAVCYCQKYYSLINKQYLACLYGVVLYFYSFTVLNLL